MRVTGIALAVALLTAPAGGAAQDKPEADSAQAPKLICKSQTEVGSLVRRKKRCYSEKDWRRIHEAAFMGGKELQERNTGVPGG